MWATKPPINLLRYLFVLRVNSTLVRLPRNLSLDLSVILGAIIATRLPTKEARPWRKALAPWFGYQGEIPSLPNSLAPAQSPAKSSSVPAVSWPLEVVLYPYPGKRMYGQGEPILWELKLLGESADHALFLELILPAIEEAGSTADPHWKRAGHLWGHFDVDSLYVARGLQWEPLAQAGRLNLQYQPTATQWAEGSVFKVPTVPQFEKLTWLTPFSLREPREATNRRKRRKKEQTASGVPALAEILTATATRLQQLQPKRRGTHNEIETIMVGANPSWPEALAQAKSVSVQDFKLKPAPKHSPGRQIGSQQFTKIPSSVIPYLNLATILHIGQYTHFGCGTFTLLTDI